MMNQYISVEDIISSCIEEMPYTVTRSDASQKAVLHNPPPSAIIHPAKVIAVTGDKRRRVTYECEITASKKCFTESTTSINTICDSIRHDFSVLPIMLRTKKGVVDVKSFKIAQHSGNESPIIRAVMVIKFEITVDIEMLRAE